MALSVSPGCSTTVLLSSPLRFTPSVGFALARLSLKMNDFAVLTIGRLSSLITFLTFGVQVAGAGSYLLTNSASSVFAVVSS